MMCKFTKACVAQSSQLNHFENNCIPASLPRDKINIKNKYLIVMIVAYVFQFFIILNLI